MKKNKKTQDPVVLCEGVQISRSLYEKKENRLSTLWLKGIIVYLICTGSIGCMLTAVEVSFSAPVLHAILFLSASIFACRYYNKITENIGGLLLLVIFIMFGIGLRNYINSGFYAILNALNDHAATYFDLSGVRVFTERINNRLVAVTVSMAYIGVVETVLLNILLVRKMRYLAAACFTMPLLLFPIYLRCEPNVFYVFMLFIGLAGAFVLRRGGHYEKVNTDAVLGVHKKKNITYIYHRRALAEAMLQVIVGILIVVVIIQILIPKETYVATQKNSSLKAGTEDIVENLVLLGISGFINKYQNTGGMRSGQLGGVSSVNLDYNTDLILRITPYSYNTVYLKYFMGGRYLPYENAWERALTQQHHEAEAAALQNAYETGNATSAEGTMEIENVAALLGPYVPYYSMEEEKFGYYDEPVAYRYYPRIFGNTVSVKQEMDWESWLQIPKENYDSIAAFCEEAGFGGSKQEVISQVISYYQENIPYTLRPGATPRNQDFINYFLTHNRKGYCTHFASAATMIFRYFGIPARYVEGYAVSYGQILEGQLVEGARYEDYYHGYSELGETALVEVEVTDASAHAWVEVYDENDGWVVVEVTPYSTEEAQRTGFWDMFFNLFGNGDEDAETGEQTDTQGQAWNPDVTKKVFGVSIIVLLVFFGGMYSVNKIRRGIVYYRASINDKLILEYTGFLHRKSRTDKQLKEKRNYREQVFYLVEKHMLPWEDQENRERLIRILEQAGFSFREISSEDYQFARESLKSRFFSF